MTIALRAPSPAVTIAPTDRIAGDPSMTPRGSTNRAPEDRPAGRRRGRGLALAAALLLAPAVVARPALAQTPPALRPSTTAQTATPADPGDRRAALRGELDAVLRDIDLGRQRQATLAADIEALGRDRGRLSSDLAATAERLREAERRLAVTEKRIGDLDRDVARSRAALEARRGILADVLAALQRIGRNPPPALVVRPRDALASVRSAILVGALLPELRDQAEALLADLQSLQALQAGAAAERDRFHGEAADLVGERERLRALLDERAKSGAEREATLSGERRRLSDLADRAGSLRDLLAALEGAASPAAPASAPAAPIGRSAATLAGGRGALPLPLIGEIVLRYGQTDAAGLGAKGLSIAARPGAAVTSPCDGAVIFAGPFRSYGKLLIINGGAGYHVLLAGMERIDVEIGQTVVAGEPVGFMGSRPGPALEGRPIEDRPVLYVEFRKDGTPIDPSPWWATARDEKVRG
jgi:septal ring factor EnvC (AmiA/AmiB activator)